MGTRNCSAFVITETDERRIASAAIIGLDRQPVRGYSTPADNGIANALYPTRTARKRSDAADTEVTPVDSLFAASALI